MIDVNEETDELLFAKPMPGESASRNLPNPTS